MFNLDFHRDNLVNLSNELDSPFFFYDLDALTDNLTKLKKLPVKLWYAVKANPLSSILQSVANQEISFDVASIGELDQVLNQGVDPSNILNTGPAKSYKQICYFLEKGVRIFVLESTQQYQDLLRATRKYQIRVTVLLRVQINWEKSSKRNVLGGDSITPFGLPPQQWLDYFKVESVDSEYVNIIGLHCFQWGNITSVAELSKLWQKITRELISLATRLKIDLKVIDLGGGLGIPYNNESQKLDAVAVAEIVAQLKHMYQGIEFWLELGRYAVGECGVYITKVIDKKKIYDKTLLVLEGGSQHLSRPFITNQAFPVFNILSGNFQKSATMELHGPLCTSIDHLGSVILDDDTSSGDSLIFMQTGAYGFTESMPFFLCHTLPAEVIYTKQQTKLIRKAANPLTWLL